MRWPPPIPVRPTTVEEVWPRLGKERLQHLVHQQGDGGKHPISAVETLGPLPGFGVHGTLCVIVVIFASILVQEIFFRVVYLRKGKVNILAMCLVLSAIFYVPMNTQINGMYMLSLLQAFVHLNVCLCLFKLKIAP